MLCKRFIPLCLFAFGVTGVAFAQVSKTYTLSADGYGPVKIGMTVKAASQALGIKLVSADDGSPNAECYHVAPASGHTGVYFMVQRYRITRVSLGYTEQKTIKTDRNITVGDNEQKVRQAYGKGLNIQQHEYGDQGDHYLTYWTSPKHQRGIRYETIGGKVMDIHGGDRSIELIEGCS